MSFFSSLCGKDDLEIPDNMENMIAFHYEFDVADPLKIKFQLSNRFDFDIYVGKYSTPLDGVRRCWKITLEDGKEAAYGGIMKKRLPMSRSKTSWTKIEGGGTLTKEVDLESSFETENKTVVDVGVNFSECQVTKTVSKTPITSKPISVGVEKTVLGK